MPKWKIAKFLKLEIFNLRLGREINGKIPLTFRETLAMKAIMNLDFRWVWFWTMNSWIRKRKQFSCHPKGDSMTRLFSLTGQILGLALGAAQIGTRSEIQIKPTLVWDQIGLNPTQGPSRRIFLRKLSCLRCEKNFAKSSMHAECIIFFAGSDEYALKLHAFNVIVHTERTWYLAERHFDLRCTQM